MDRLRNALWPDPRPSTRATLVLAAVGLAALTLLAHNTLKADPSGWLRWGRELAVGEGGFDTYVYPSWKPFPVLFTAPLALTGPLAPALWLVVSRAGGFIAMALVARLAARLGGRTAGAIALVALALVPDWWPTLLGGQVEPMLLALLLLAVERHRAGRPLHALGLGTLVALGREEVWPLLVIYGVLVARDDRRRAPLVAAVLAALPLVWFGGDWLGSGDPFRGGVLAQESLDAAAQRASGPLGPHALDLASQLFILPLWCAVTVGVAAAVRARRPLALVLAAAGLLWTAMDVLVAFAGYPCEPRFFLPAAGLLCVVAATGAAELLSRARERIVRPLIGTVPAMPAEQVLGEPAASSIARFPLLM